MANTPHDDPPPSLHLNEGELPPIVRTVTLAGGGAAAIDQQDHHPGDRIGPYRLLESIGQGTFGTVWKAERVEGGFQQAVALKITRSSAASRQQLQRFEFERQTLASLEHPGIARVFDGGDAGGGALYYVMELVNGGRPITTFCRERALSVPDRLRLFLQACEALEHAHKQMVIHRDISPNNILAYQEPSTAKGPGRLRVKLIDFGLAKAMGTTVLQPPGAAERAGTPMGTMAYASPEQLRGEQGTDARSDVYAMGAVLYELLVDSPPISGDELPAGQSRERWLQFLTQSQPPSPSDRLSRMAASGALARERVESIAKTRRTTLERLQRDLREDLNWLPMKALEKLREDRYQSVEALAVDIRNYLEWRPLVAHPPSARYVARKFVRRHRGKVAVAGVTSVALVAAVIVIVMQSIETRRLYDQSEQRLKDQLEISAFQRSMLAGVDPAELGLAWSNMLREKLDAKLTKQEALLTDAKAREAAEQERNRRIEAFGEDLRRLNTTDVASEFLAQLVDRWRKVIDEKFAENPSVRADLLQAIVEIKLKLGMEGDQTLWPTQETVLKLREPSASERPAELADAQYWCAWVRSSQGGSKGEEAPTWARLALDARERLHPADHEAVAASLLQIGELAQLKEALEALRRVERGSEFTPETRFQAAASLGTRLCDAGRPNEALKLLEEVERRGQLDRFSVTKAEGEELRAQLENNLGFAQERMAIRLGLPNGEKNEHWKEAARRYERALTIDIGRQGRDHPTTIDTANSLALALMNLGAPESLQRAFVIADENLTSVERNRPPEEMLQTRSTKAKLCAQAGDAPQALRLSDQVMQDARRFYERGDRDFILTAKARGEVLDKIGRLPEAQALLWSLVKDRLDYLERQGETGYDMLLLNTACDLLNNLVKQGRLDQLDEVFRLCDARAAAGDDATKDGKYVYLQTKAAALRKWSEQDPSCQASAAAAEQEVKRVEAQRVAAGFGVAASG